MRSGRRIARKIGHDEEDDEAPQGIEASSASTGAGSVVRRPVTTPRGHAKAKKPSNLRTSFNVDEDISNAGEETVLPPEGKLSRLAIGRNTHRRDDPLQNVTSRATSSLENRPDYSADYLNELKSSTQNISRPSEAEQSDSEKKPLQPELDIASKFGDSALALSQPEKSSSYRIPTEAEIQEKKDRRRRLAKEQDFIAFDDGDRDEQRSSGDDSDDGDYRKQSLIIHAEDDFVDRSKYGETRLVHEDEDIAEGFDEFVEDAGKVALSRKSAKRQEKDRREAMEEQIRSAQHGYGYGAAGASPGDESEGDQEESARNAAWDAAQTRAGTYGMTGAGITEKSKEERFRRKLEMPTVKPVPEFQSVVARFTDMVAAKELEMNANRKRLERLEKEKDEIEEDESRIKGLLQEAGERFEKLRGGDADGERDKAINGHAEHNASEAPSDTSMKGSSASENEESADENAPSGDILSHVMGGFPRQSPSGMAQIAREEDEYSE